MSSTEAKETGERLIKIDLDAVLLFLWQKRAAIALSTFLPAVIAVAASFFVTPLFTAEATFLPTGNRQLPVFFKSRTVAARVLELLPEVKTLLNSADRDAAEQAVELSKAVRIVAPSRKEHPFALCVELANATMAAEVANTYLTLVASYVRDPEYDLSSRKTIFIRDQLNINLELLRNAENALRSFQEAHGIILLDSQTAATVGMVAQIEARLVKKEIELQALQSTPDNPVAIKRANEVNALKDTLKELKGEQESFIFTAGNLANGDEIGIMPGLADAARLRINQKKLQRDVDIAEQTFLYLQNQLNEAKIQEEKDSRALMTIDPAITPKKHSYPNRPLFALFGGLLGFMLSLFVVLIQFSRVRGTLS